MLRRRKIKFSEKALQAEADRKLDEILSETDDLGRTYDDIRQLQDMLKKKDPKHFLIPLIMYGDKILKIGGKEHVVKNMPLHTPGFVERYGRYIREYDLSPTLEANKIYRSDLERAVAGLEVPKTR